MIALAAAVSAIAVGGAIWFGVSRFQGEDPDVGATSPNSDQPASPSRSPQSAGSAGPPAPGAAPVELVLGPEIDPKAAMAGGFDQFFFNPLDTETVAVLGIAQNPERSPALALAAFDLGTGGLK
jgi:hypothetical protein